MTKKLNRVEFTTLSLVPPLSHINVENEQREKREQKKGEKKGTLASLLSSNFLIAEENCR